MVEDSLTEFVKNIDIDKGCCMCLNEDSQTLKYLLEFDDGTQDGKEIAEQANMLIQLGFKETDEFCSECFWK